MASETKLETVFYELEAKTDLFDQQIERARKTLRTLTTEKTPEITVGADTKPLERDLAKAKTKVKELGGDGQNGATVKLTANVDALEKALAEAKRQAAELGATRQGKPLQAKLDAQISAFEAKIKRAKAQIDTLATQPRTVKLDAQTATLELSLKKLGVDLANFGDETGAKLNVSAPLEESTSAAKTFADEFQIAGRSVGGSATEMAAKLANPYVAVAALTTAVATLSIVATKEAAKLDTAFRSMQSALPSDASAEGLGQLKDVIVSLSEVTPRLPEELAGVAKAIADMGTADPAEVGRNLQTIALVGDAVGATDLKPLADQLDLIGDAFQLTSEQARQAFVQIAAMAKGRISLEDLSGVLAKSATRMNALGISAQEAASAMVVLVDAGVNSRQITTGLIELLDKAGAAQRAASEAMAAGKTNDAKALQIFAETVNDSNVRSLGLVGTLGKLYTAMDGNRAAFERAGLSLNDFQIAQKAAAAAADGASTKVLSYAESLAKLGPAAQLNRESASALAQIIKNELSAQLVDLGNIFLPKVISGLEILADLLSRTRREAKGAAEALPDIQGLLDRGMVGQASRKAQPVIASINNTPGFLNGFDIKQLLALQNVLAKLDAAGEGGAGMGKALETLRDRIREVNGAANNTIKVVPPAGKSLEDLSAAAKAAAEKLDAAREQYEKMLDSFRDLSDVERAHRAIDDFAESQRKAGVSADVVAQRVKELHTELDRQTTRRQAQEMRDYARALADGADELNKLMKAEKDKIEAENRKKRAGEENIANLQAEAKALVVSEEAYKRLATEIAKKQAIEEAGRAAEREPGANETSINLAKNLAARTFDAQQNIERIKDELNKIASGGIAAALGNVASQFTQIATSLGDAGQGMARAAGVLGPILTGIGSLSAALKRPKLDEAGNLIEGQFTMNGFFDTLKGKNGAGAQAKAIAGSVAIVGAVAQVADMLDVFGTHAREKARLLKEAAEAFDKALQQFVLAASPDSGATAGIRKAQETAADLTKQARALAQQGTLFASQLGNQLEIGTTVTSQQLAEIAATFAQLAKLSGGKTSKQAADLAARFGELADALKANEQAAREQVLRNIEDLGVRKLQAAGLTAQADALRKEIENRRALQAASKDVTEEGQQYYRALLAITEAEAAAAAEIQRRAGIMARLDDEEAILGGSSLERIQRLVRGLADAFGPQFASIFDGIDLSTREGLQKAKDKLKELYVTLAADGIDENERPIVDFIKRILGSIDTAIGDLPDGLTTLNDKLDAFDERIKLLGGSLTEQLGQLGAIYGDQFNGALNDLIKNADLSTATGRAEFKNRIQEQIANILGDGVITEEEKPLLAALGRLLGIANQALDQATADAEKLASDAEAKRQQAVSRRQQNANADIQLGDLTGVDAFRAGLGQYSDALHDFFQTFDPTTIENIGAAKTQIRSLRAEINTLSDQEIIDRFGMTRDEVLAALVDVDNGLDNLAEGLRTLAQQQGDFLDQLNAAYFDAFDMGFEAVRLQTDIWVAQMKETAAKLFTGTKLDEINAQIDAIGAQRISNWQKQQNEQNQKTSTSGTGAARNYTISGGISLEDIANMSPQERAAYYESAAVQAVLRNGVTNGQVQAMPVPDATAAGDPNQRDTFVASDITRTSETTALRMTDYLASGLIEWRRTAVATESLTAQFGELIARMMGAPALMTPALPASMGAFSTGGGGINITLVINLNGPLAGDSVAAARELAANALPYLNAGLLRAAGIEARNSGNASLS